MQDPFHARATLDTAAGPVTFYRLAALEQAGLGDLARLPYSIRILLECALRTCDNFAVTEDHVRAIAAWQPDTVSDAEIPFIPARVLLQDFTGVPAVVDLAAMRAAVARLGGDPRRINPHVPVDLVIDHSVHVTAFGCEAALAINVAREFERNEERYTFLRWGQGAFANFRVVPPGSGIIHQVNLEYLASVVQTHELDGTPVAFPDTVVGTDSHTTMVNGLGVLGWGVGGIEAEAVMLAQPIYMLLPPVVGFRLTGRLPEGATATDLVLTVTQQLRTHGVVGKFVEYFGPGVAELSLPDRATVANMAPEYGATMGFFPVDDVTLRYLEQSGRGHLVDLVDRYCRAQGLFRGPDAPEPTYSEVIELDMGTVEPTVAGPRRPHDRVALGDAKAGFWQFVRERFGHEIEPVPGIPPAVYAWLAGEGAPPDPPGTRLPARRSLYDRHAVEVALNGQRAAVSHGSVVIAAITSCTNTSNPSVMVAAGLLARKAVERGLARQPWVKTSLAPGSRVVTRYLENAGLMPALQQLGFHVVGYGCTTCIGNSGQMPAGITEAVTRDDLVLAAVLSGNRNFEGRISPVTRANYLASPPLVVAYALAGTLDIDLSTEPLGTDRSGQPVYLADIWPTQAEVAAAIERGLSPELFTEEYGRIFEGSLEWRRLPAPTGLLYEWQPDSTYIREPTFFLDLAPEPPAIGPIRGARALALLRDFVTTDHISPAGAIRADSPAGRYLQAQGVTPDEFNSYGARRGNHEVMMRGTFGNIRLRNQLVPDTEGSVTTHVPSGEVMTIFDAATRYRDAGVPLVILAGLAYGSGSSRDWAAKGVYLLGVKAVIAKSYERIHRSNLVGMGVLPLEFLDGEGWAELGLTGQESFDLAVPADLRPRSRVAVTATAADGGVTRFETIARIDSAVEVTYYRNGGILHTMLREMLHGNRPG